MRADVPKPLKRSKTDAINVLSDARLRANRERSDTRLDQERSVSDLETLTPLADRQAITQPCACGSGGSTS